MAKTLCLNKQKRALVEREKNMIIAGLNSLDNLDASEGLERKEREEKKQAEQEARQATPLPKAGSSMSFLDTGPFLDPMSTCCIDWNNITYFNTCKRTKGQRLSITE